MLLQTFGIAVSALLLTGVLSVVDLGAMINLQSRSRRNAMIAAQRLHRQRAEADEAARAVRSAGLPPAVQPLLTHMRGIDGAPRRSPDGSPRSQRHE